MEDEAILLDLPLYERLPFGVLAPDIKSQPVERSNMSDAIRNCDLPATPAPIVSQPRYGTRPSDRVEDAALTRAVDFILDDCFFMSARRSACG